MLFFFFFKQKTAYELRISDWSSDVCSSDLRRHEDVVVLDVAQLVSDHALELDAVQLLEQARGDGDGRVLRVAPGGEGVRRGIVDDVDAGLGEPACDAEPLDEVVQPRVLLHRRGLGPADGEGDGVGLPVRSEAHTSELQSLMRTSYARFCRQ